MGSVEERMQVGTIRRRKNGQQGNKKVDREKSCFAI